MKFFIIYNPADRETANSIAKEISNAGHSVKFISVIVDVGTNLFEKIKHELTKVDALILIISKKSLASKPSMQLFSALAFGDLSNKKQMILPVLIDKSPVPNYLSQYLFIDLAEDFNLGLRKLVALLGSKQKIQAERPKEELKKQQKERTYSKQLNEIANALHSGRLTLVCGAGISVDAGVPAWNSLLLTLLESMMWRVSDDHSISLKVADAEAFQSRYSPSSLIMGKYLKNNLGNDFLKEVRKALYSNDPHSCEIIDAIVDLSRPQRFGNPVDSIISFNFDGLLEENLGLHNIRHKAIYGEGIRNSPNELPIYHVHGYLPRTGSIPNGIEIVFSEDAYHSQFIEPFSWSNLIQLNKFSQNTCLFIGLSLTDPNLRRLLDVAHRKYPERTLNHYLIKKAPNNSNSSDTLDDLAQLLEEQDANDLGLNIIWISNFNEIPEILKKLSETNR